MSTSCIRVRVQYHLNIMIHHYWQLHSNISDNDPERRQPPITQTKDSSPYRKRKKDRCCRRRPIFFAYYYSPALRSIEKVLVVSRKNQSRKQQKPQKHKKRKPTLFQDYDVGTMNCLLVFLIQINDSAKRKKIDVLVCCERGGYALTLPYARITISCYYRNLSILLCFNLSTKIFVQLNFFLAEKKCF